MNLEKQLITIILSLIISFLLLTVSMSYWFYSNVYNKTNFEQHVSSAIDTQNAKKALSSLIIQRLKEEPTVKGYITSEAEPAVNGILDNLKVPNLENSLMAGIHNSLFSGEPKAVVVDLSSVKKLKKDLYSFVLSATGTQIEEINIPNSIELTKKGDVPSISAVGMSVMWLGPVAFIAGILFFIWLYRRTPNKSALFIIFGLSLAGLSLFSVLFIQFLKPLLLTPFSNGDIRIVAGEIMNEFLNALSFQNILLMFLGVLFLIEGFVFRRYFSASHR